MVSSLERMELLCFPTSQQLILSMPVMLEWCTTALPLMPLELSAAQMSRPSMQVRGKRGVAGALCVMYVYIPYWIIQLKTLNFVSVESQLVCCVLPHHYFLLYAHACALSRKCWLMLASWSAQLKSTFECYSIVQAFIKHGNVEIANITIRYMCIRHLNNCFSLLFVVLFESEFFMYACVSPVQPLLDFEMVMKLCLVQSQNQHQ